ncbi:MAG: hypothetical protein K8I00_02580 [Candidatus Omnitrophica bacterium]|nr:hypothetical protein [Candidatus Omnitrophota bacterium]
MIGEQRLGSVESGWRLFDRAVGASITSYALLINKKAELALCISCIRQKLILELREKEKESVAEVLGDAVMTGYYFYGRGSSFIDNVKYEFYNGKMTMPTFAEEYL